MEWAGGLETGKWTYNNSDKVFNYNLTDYGSEHAIVIKVTHKELKLRYSYSSVIYTHIRIIDKNKISELDSLK